MEEVEKLIADARAAMDYRDDTGWFWVGRLADALEAAARVPVQGEPNVCLDHKPVQHRDGKPPWCRECGKAEWEYGVRGTTGQMINNGTYQREQTHRRRKAGPWLPVEGESK